MREIFCLIQGDRVQFEKDCQHIQSTIDDFLLWINRTLTDSDHPLSNYSIDEFFAYADYMHLPELFGDEQHPLIDVNKQIFKFEFKVFCL